MVKRLIPELRPRVERVGGRGRSSGRRCRPASAGSRSRASRCCSWPRTCENAAFRPAARPTATRRSPIGTPSRVCIVSRLDFRPGDFVQAFRAAFEILDRRNGSTNFVKLADLRDALSEFSREEFDAGLRQLRMEGIFSLDSHEGLHGSLSDDEREAGVREAGSLLVYASRR